MRLFNFNTPQEKIEPKFWTAINNTSNVNVGKYVRNSILDGKTYSAGDHIPAWLKTRDAVHPYVGMKNWVNDADSDYGGIKVSAVLQPGILDTSNEKFWWTPVGNGIDSWIQVKLPEPTFIESYAIGTKSVNAPLSWKLQGSTDEATWIDIHVLENTGAWDETYELKEFIIPEETRGIYLYYRLYITGSNVTTMSLRNFRLFRPQSVCAKGQLLIDASIESPLSFSFADGFDVDGVTPIDHTKIINSPILLNMFDGDGYPTVRNSPISYNIPININAVLDSNTGFVSIELEDAVGSEIIQAEGGMASVDDKGWECSLNNFNGYNYFGKTSGSDITMAANQPFTFLTKNPNGVFASKLYVGALLGTANMSSKYTPGPIYAIEMDDSVTYIGGSKLYNVTYQINRTIKGIKYTTPTPSKSYSVRFRGMSLYSLSKPQYRFNNGKLYTRMTSVSEWVLCCKVKIGNILLTPTGEVLKPISESTIWNQLMLGM